MVFPHVFQEIQQNTRRSNGSHGSAANSDNSDLVVSGGRSGRPEHSSLTPGSKPWPWCGSTKSGESSTWSGFTLHWPKQTQTNSLENVGFLRICWRIMVQLTVMVFFLHLGFDGFAKRWKIGTQKTSLDSPRSYRKEKFSASEIHDTFSLRPLPTILPMTTVAKILLLFALWILWGSSQENRLWWNVAFELKLCPTKFSQLLHSSGQFSSTSTRSAEVKCAPCWPGPSQVLQVKLAGFLIKLNTPHPMPLKVSLLLSTHGAVSFRAVTEPSKKFSWTVKTARCFKSWRETGKFPESSLWCRVRITKFAALTAGISPSNRLLFRDKRFKLANCMKHAGNLPVKWLWFRWISRKIPPGEVGEVQKDFTNGSKDPIRRLWLKSSCCRCGTGSSGNSPER